MQNSSSFCPRAPSSPFKQNEKINGLESYAANIMRIPWMMLTNKDVDADLVYSMVKTVAENKQALAESFGLFNLARPETMAPANEVPYHPGAVKYYEEAGIAIGN